jgi:hypothetical protein
MYFSRILLTPVLNGNYFRKKKFEFSFMDQTHRPDQRRQPDLLALSTCHCLVGPCTVAAHRSVSTSLHWPICQRKNPQSHRPRPTSRCVRSPLGKPSMSCPVPSVLVATSCCKSLPPPRTPWAILSALVQSSRPLCCTSMPLPHRCAAAVHGDKPLDDKALAARHRLPPAACSSRRRLAPPHARVDSHAMCHLVSAYCHVTASAK